jgi:sugar phosphate isomerase/epimerase
VSARGIATALYGWMERYAREGVEWDWERIYDDCAAAGVDAVETDPLPEKVRILERLGLRVSSSYIGIPLDEPLPGAVFAERILPVAHRLADAGGTTLVMNADAFSTPRVLADNLNRIAGAVAPLGLEVALHNHADEPVRAAAELSAVIELADPSVGLCIDTGWAVVAGHDPVAWAREHAARVRAFHLRTVDAAGTPAEDLTSGAPDIRALLAAAPGFDGWLILELWHPDAMRPSGSMIEANRRSVELLRGLVGPKALP